jgi:hypothetical protein
MRWWATATVVAQAWYLVPIRLPSTHRYLSPLPPRHNLSDANRGSQYTMYSGDYPRTLYHGMTSRVPIRFDIKEIFLIWVIETFTRDYFDLDRRTMSRIIRQIHHCKLLKLKNAGHLES